jgi:hypothetical protein
VEDWQPEPLYAGVDESPHSGLYFHRGEPASHVVPDDCIVLAV